MDRLVVNVDKILNNCSTYLEVISELEEMKNKLNNNDFDSDIKDVEKALEPYKQQSCSSIEKIIKKSENHIEKIDDCCGKYKKNEADIQNVDIGSIIEVLKTDPDFVVNYESDTLKNNISLKSYKVYNKWGFNPETHEYNPNACIRPLPDGTFSVTSPFGYRIHPIYGYKKFHSGIDLGASSGTDISSTMYGKVISAGYNGGYGNCVIIENGDTQTLYAHMSSINVKQGQTINSGQKIGEVGSTGASTGPHLHYEVKKNGEVVDPAPYLGLDD